MWAHPAVPAARKLGGSLVVGTRPHAPPKALGHDPKPRLRPGHRPVRCTDASAGYASALLDACGRRSPAPAHGANGRSRRAILRWPQGWADGQVNKQEKGRGMERVEGRILDGKARGHPVRAWLGYTQVQTRVVARHNGTSRWRNQRQVRTTLACSTVPRSHRWMRWLAVGLDNFCRAPRSGKSIQPTQGQQRSPAMAARFTDHMWTRRAWRLWPVVGGQG